MWHVTWRDGQTPCRHIRLIHRLAAPLAMAALVSVALASCGNSSSALSASTILQRAQVRFEATSTFHFALQASHLGANDPQPITSATGDVQRPDQLKTDMTANLSGFTLQLQLIIIGQRQWISNPLTGKFEPTQDYGSLLTIFDAQRGVGAILTHLQQPTDLVSSSSVSGACWKISGKVGASELAAVVGGVVKSSSVPVSVCIGKSDNELYSTTLAGPVTQTDTSATRRTFTLSAFDKPVSIQAPA